MERAPVRRSMRLEELRKQRMRLSSSKGSSESLRRSSRLKEMRKRRGMEAAKKRKKQNASYSRGKKLEMRRDPSPHSFIENRTLHMKLKFYGERCDFPDFSGHKKIRIKDNRIPGSAHSHAVDIVLDSSSDFCYMSYKTAVRIGILDKIESYHWVVREFSMGETVFLMGFISSFPVSLTDFTLVMRVDLLVYSQRMDNQMKVLYPDIGEFDVIIGCWQMHRYGLILTYEGRKTYLRARATRPKRKLRNVGMKYTVESFCTYKDHRYPLKTLVASGCMFPSVSTKLSRRMFTFDWPETMEIKLYRKYYMYITKMGLHNSIMDTIMSHKVLKKYRAAVDFG